jgi:hypothetical protein
LKERNSPFLARGGPAKDANQQRCFNGSLFMEDYWVLLVFRGGSERETTGIWMWSKVYLLPQGNREVAVVLMDTQVGFTVWHCIVQIIQIVPTEVFFSEFSEIFAKITFS